MTPADELTLAAERLEALDAAATPGPWAAEDDPRFGSAWQVYVDPDDAIGDTVTHGATKADAAFIAALRGVAKPLAAWLRASAKTCQRLLDELATLEAPVTLEQVYGYDFTEALTLAREVIRATGGTP